MELTHSLHLDIRSIPEATPAQVADTELLFQDLLNLQMFTSNKSLSQTLVDVASSAVAVLDEDGIDCTALRFTVEDQHENVAVVYTPGAGYRML